ncbi:hypothetical protein [Streptomyces lunaelactis]|uniref:hypothetical protein n=1 Tax=Streptomyces lunaelactis TaxID=1535768 RepID=UPI00158573A7|nr:hypothetical protein [Streptomyces lunaelactis]NUK01075.1 hypothetical protein [Streptomyces lunaelactis]NUL13322.1 hypothetical protein [Streptomyces lunaelactis]NUL26172.1 hypothetical protein [Streptomyces lunaelactis]
MYDLITCVHGLHYVGDQLGLLARAATWLAPQALLIAHLDPDSIRCADDRSDGRPALAALRAAGFSYSARHHRLTLRGARRVDLPWSYLGADPHAGPNYTGQPAVASYYQPAMPGQDGIKPHGVPVGGPCHQPGGGRGA